MTNAGDVIRDAERAALEESKRLNQRPASVKESEAIQMLIKVLFDVAPEIVAVFNKGQTRYTVANSEIVLGQLRSSRAYRAREVYLAESVFIADFPEAVAIFLHEHAHIFGHDGSRGFTDALTELLESIIRTRHELDECERRWVAKRKEVLRERKISGRKATSSDDTLKTWIESLNEHQLKNLMNRVPAAVLKKLQSRVGD